MNPPYELGWKDKFIIDAEGNPTTATQQVFETYQNVKQEIRDQLNAEAEAIQIILTGIDNDIYSQLMLVRMPVRCGKRLRGGTFMKRRPEECYDLIENMTAHHNDWDTSAQRSESSNSITSSSDMEITALKDEMAKINKNLMRVLQVNQQVKAVTPNCETYGGPHSFFDCPATDGNTQNVYAAGAYQAYQAPAYQALIHQPQIPQRQVVTTNEFTNFMKANDAIPKNMQTNMTSLTNSNLELKNMFGQFMKMNTVSPSGSRTLLGNRITNPKEDLKGITTRSGTAYQGPTIPTTTSSSLVVERETEATKDMVHPTNNGSTEDFQPLVVPTESLILNSEPVVPIIEPVASPVSAPKPNFANALILMPKFGPSIKSLLTNKDKLSLADLGASINLMPLFVWNKLSLPDLSPTCMNLELANRSISRPVGVAEDVFVKVGTFHFPSDFVVVDFDADPRVPLILERSFLKTGRALIDVFEGELTFRVSKETITFNLDQTSRYSANYIDMTANRIDVIDMACEEYSQEVLSFSDVIASGNPTPYYDLIGSTTSSTLTPFRNSDFLLEEVDAFLALEDDPTSLKVDQSYLDSEGDILLLEAILNDDPSLPPPNQGNYLPEVRKELKIYKATSDKSFIDERPEVELKDLPPHLKYAFLEDQEKTTFTCPYETFAYHRMPFGLCNAPGTFQRCMMALFHDMIEKTMEVFMDDYSVFRNSFKTCLSHLEKMLKRYEGTNLYLNWEKSHFMVKEGIVLGHKISKNRIEVDKAKVDVIAKLPHPTTVNGYSQLSWSCQLLSKVHSRLFKDSPADDPSSRKRYPIPFLQRVCEAFQTLKRKLTKAPILITPDWDMPFELMCDASNFAIGAVLGQRQDKHFRPIHYASKTMTKVESNYTTTKKEILVVVYAFENFWSYLIMNKSIMYTDHSALKYLFAKKDSKEILLRWVLLLQEFTFKVIDINGAENLAADHLS
nr:reverse transcriptase domain-containing protein [Tanacetum cinerariifolium]